MSAVETIHAGSHETLDELLWRTKGLGPSALGDVLGINPGLAARGAILPLGLPVKIPAAALADRPTLPITQLWD